MGADLKEDGWCENCQGAIRCDGISRSGLVQWQRGCRRLRESQVVAFAVGIPGGPEDVADL